MCSVVGCSPGASVNTPGISSAKELHVSYASAPNTTPNRPALPPRDLSRGRGQGSRGQGSRDVKSTNSDFRAAKRNIYYTRSSGHNPPCMIHAGRGYVMDSYETDYCPVISSEIHV